jgi:hypothetical protein
LSRSTSSGVDSIAGTQGLSNSDLLVGPTREVCSARVVIPSGSGWRASLASGREFTSDDRRRGSAPKKRKALYSQIDDIFVDQAFVEAIAVLSIIAAATCRLQDITPLAHDAFSVKDAWLNV